VTLNGVTAISRYFAEYGSNGGQLREVFESRHILYATVKKTKKSSL